MEDKSMSLLDWLYLILTVNTPILGWIVVIVGAIGKNKTKEKKMFCRAYIIFKLIMLVISSICLYYVFNIAIGLIEQGLNMMQ